MTRTLAGLMRLAQMRQENEQAAGGDAPCCDPRINLAERRVAAPQAEAAPEAVYKAPAP